MGSPTCINNDTPLEVRAEINKVNAPIGDVHRNCKEDAPDDDGKTPNEDEAGREKEADEDARVDAEIKWVDAEIQFDVGVELGKLAPFPLIKKIFANSPKFIESCDLCPAAPMLSHSAPNRLWVEIGRTIGATGKTSGTVPAGARLWRPPAQAQGSDGADVAAALTQGNGD